jgi:competence ComEA-like helix-hairpin-helix protein
MRTAAIQPQGTSRADKARFDLRRGLSGSILVGLLWCVALLSVLVIGLLRSATLDLRVAKNHGDLIQAHYLALAGIEHAKALLYQDAAARQRAAQNHSGQLSDTPELFQDARLGRGHFRVFRQGTREEGGRILFGVSDEESRLNVNHASAEELRKLYAMTPDVAAAILDFRDEDNAVTPGGAEAEYYLSLDPPYLPRNGPFQTVRELLMVRGISQELLFGEDANQNGLLDPEEDDGNELSPPDNRDGILDAGWSEHITVDSAVRNLSASGQARVPIQSGDESALAALPGLSSELAKAIVAWRSRTRLENLADLLDVTAVSQQTQPPSQAAPASTTPDPAQPEPVPPPSSASPTGPRLISEELLMEIADDLTASDASSQPGAVNINTANSPVLACLPGVDQQLAQAIVSHRRSAGFFSNIAELLKVPGMNRQIFKQVAPRVTARSETFRILSEGTVSSTGARKRIQVIVRVSSIAVETLSYREDL